MVYLSARSQLHNWYMFGESQENHQFFIFSLKGRILSTRVSRLKRIKSHLLYALRRDPHAHPVTDIKAKGFLGAMLVESYPPVCLRQNVHIDDGRNLSEVLWWPNHEAGPVL